MGKSKHPSKKKSRNKSSMNKSQYSMRNNKSSMKLVTKKMTPPKDSATAYLMGRAHPGSLKNPMSKFMNNIMMMHMKSQRTSKRNHLQSLMKAMKNLTNNKKLL